MESARRARRKGLDVDLVAPPVGRLRDIFMREYNKRDWAERPPHCRHCGAEGQLVNGRVIYPKRADLFHLLFWLCPCGAYVGIHTRSTYAAPKGLMATAEHRYLKSRAHEALNLLQYGRRNMTRSEAQAWLQKALGADRPVYIGWSSLDQLRLIIELCEREESDE